MLALFVKHRNSMLLRGLLDPELLVETGLNEDYFIERNVMKEQKLVKEYCISPTNIIRDVYEISDVASGQADINKLTMGNIQAIRHGPL
ncbi:hypothetical protein M8J77_004749 [Diaphorina citri]|nr:hypothetical protein M8J77_004749 [Diaphorina citri]